MGFLTDLIGAFLVRGEAKKIQRSLAKNGEYQQASKDFDESFERLNKILEKRKSRSGLNFGDDNESKNKEWDF